MVASASLPISWASLHTAACDDAGNVYVLTSNSETDWTLASLDRERRLRWKVRAPTRWEYMESANRIHVSAWSEAGELVVWTEGRPSAHRISCRDGSVVGALGGTGDGHIDLTSARSLAVDKDGSLLVVAGGVLRRFTSEGAPLPLWEGSPLTQVALVEPTIGAHAFVFVGWDAATWVTTYRSKGVLWGENWDGLWPRLRRFDRAGQTLAWSKPFFLLRESSAGWADREGHPFAVWLIAATFPRLMRYTKDVKSFEYWLVSSAGPPHDPTEFDAETLRSTRGAPGTVYSENVLCVAPDGAIWAFGSLDHLRCFDASGEATFVSTASRAADANVA